MEEMKIITGVLGAVFGLLFLMNKMSGKKAFVSWIALSLLLISVLHYGGKLAG